MYGLKNSFEKISEEIKIPFNIIEKDGTVIANLLGGYNKEIIETNLKIQTEDFILEVPESYINCIDLLKYCLEQELKNAVKSKEEIINDILKGREFSTEALNQVIKYKPFKLIVIYLEEKTQKVIKLLEKKYLEKESILVKVDDYIVVISKNDITENKIENILIDLKECTKGKGYISYARIDEYFELKEKFEYLKANIEVCIKYGLADKVYDENSLLLERLLSRVSDNERKRIFSKYNEVFSRLDEDLIKTIEVFFNKGLCISEAADKLFIHRNTLFYRIDKIKKIVNYDITNFNEATEFRILFLVWKETSDKNNF
ncbi:PucR family transcriptional regulator [Clostridium carnis]